MYFNGGGGCYASAIAFVFPANRFCIHYGTERQEKQFGEIHKEFRVIFPERCYTVERCLHLAKTQGKPEQRMLC